MRLIVLFGRLMSLLVQMSATSWQ